MTRRVEHSDHWSGSPAGMARPMHIHDDSDAGCLERVRPTEAGGTIYRCTAPGIYPTGVVVVVQPGGRPYATELAKAPR